MLISFSTLCLCSFIHRFSPQNALEHLYILLTDAYILAPVVVSTPAYHEKRFFMEEAHLNLREASLGFNDPLPTPQGVLPVGPSTWREGGGKEGWFGGKGTPV